LVPKLMENEPPSVPEKQKETQEEPIEHERSSDIVGHNSNEARGTKRGRDDDETHALGYYKTINLGTAHKKPIAVSTETEWYLGIKGDDLFIRQSTEDCFNIIRDVTQQSREEWEREGRDSYVAFVVTSAPGLGKSWCSNAVVWNLLHRRQSM